MRTLADYTLNDVAPEDQAGYAKHVDRWQLELHPSGELENYFAAEVVRAAWRLERYAIFDLDPTMSDQARANWLRHHDQTNLAIRRNLEELRRLQSDRYLQAHLGILLPGVASLKLVLPGLKQAKKDEPHDPASAKRRDNPTPAEISRSEAILHAQIQDEERRQLEEFHKNNPDREPVALSPRPESPRNAPCPCNSGRKYKQCCGHWSKTPMPRAA